MSYHCYRCKTTVTLSSSGRIGRTESCPSCGVDLHCCKNCQHYDTNAYNDCRESSADRVVDKERGNFCDYFRMRVLPSSSTPPARTTNTKADRLKELDNLFKK